MKKLDKQKSGVDVYGFRLVQRVDSIKFFMNLPQERRRRRLGKNFIPVSLSIFMFGMLQKETYNAIGIIVGSNRREM